MKVYEYKKHFLYKIKLYFENKTDKLGNAFFSKITRNQNKV